ncbi:MAG: zinc ribbon domain-containing protein [Candidatus Omnitrophota bacterium]
MPTYDYVCNSCKHAFELFQSMTAKTLKKCPSCGKPSLKRLIGAGSGIIFKGSGFYETDYKRSSASSGSKTSAPKCDGAGKGPSCSSCPAAKKKE